MALVSFKSAMSKFQMWCLKSPNLLKIFAAGANVLVLIISISGLPGCLHGDETFWTKYKKTDLALLNYYRKSTFVFTHYFYALHFPAYSSHQLPAGEINSTNYHRKPWTQLMSFWIQLLAEQHNLYCSQIYSVITFRLNAHHLPSTLRTSLGIPDLVNNFIPHNITIDDFVLKIKRHFLLDRMFFYEPILIEQLQCAKWD